MYLTSSIVALILGAASAPSALAGSVYHRYSLDPRDISPGPIGQTAGSAALAGALGGLASPGLGTLGAAAAAGAAAGMLAAGHGNCNVTYITDPNTNLTGNCPQSFDTLDDLMNSCGKISVDCQNRYILGAMSKELTSALNNYTDMVKNGYDDKFNTYQDYIRELVPSELKNWMAANASKSGYWTCVDQQNANCCSKCGATDYSCFQGCDNSPGCQDGWANKTIPCPTQRAPDAPIYYSQVTDTPDAMWFTLKDADGFYKDIDATYGIDKTWVHQVDLDIGNNPGCGDPGVIGHKCDTSSYWHGFPDATKFNVPNPKDTVQKALANYTIMAGMLADAAANDNFGLLWDAEADVIDASSLPLFMLQEAVDAMASIVKEANAIDDAKRKEMIMGFVMGILMLLPAVGELADAAGLAMLARIISLTSDAGDAATGIYGAVQDPKNAIWALFGAFALGSRAWKEGAAARRAMSADQLGKLGTNIQTKANKLETMMIKCQ